MAKMADRIADLERRMLIVESELGLTKLIDKEKKYLEELIERNNMATEISKSESEEIINGYPKSQLLIMFAWARNLKLNQITKNDFDELKKWGVLRDFYPDAPDNYGDIIL